MSLLESRTIQFVFLVIFISIFCLSTFRYTNAQDLQSSLSTGIDSQIQNLLGKSINKMIQDTIDKVKEATNGDPLPADPSLYGNDFGVADNDTLTVQSNYNTNPTITSLPNASNIANNGNKIINKTTTALQTNIPNIQISPFSLE